MPSGFMTGSIYEPSSAAKVSVRVPDDYMCPHCNAPKEYLYKNNGSHNQILRKVCGKSSSCNPHGAEFANKLFCPHCSHTLVAKKDRKFFRVHKCVNPKCPYYLNNLKKVDKKHLSEPYGKNYKLHYIYREFTVDFFDMELSSLPKNSSSLKFSKHNAHIMSLCLTLHVNLGLSLRKTAQAMNDLYGIKGYIWFIMDAVSRSVLGYRVSDNRGVGPCILAMRMAFREFKDKLPENFKFIADGYSAYLLVAQQFFIKKGNAFRFDVTQVIGLTNDDAVSAEFRPYFSFGYRVLNKVDMLESADNMPGKWQLLIYIGQKTIAQLQNQQTTA